MAINFPSTTGQPTDGSYTFTVSGTTYSWDGESWNALGTSESNSLGQLTDVDLSTAPTTGQVLKYNGTIWNAAADATGGGGGGSNAITQGNTSVTVTDTGSNGEITFNTEGTDRWDITSAGHLLPETNANYDIGSAERKVRHLFLSDNSLKFIDGSDTEFSLGVSGGQLYFNGKITSTTVSGAVGDGSANDTNAIQAAIDAAAFAGGGEVFLPAGIYMIDAASSSTAASNRPKDGGLLMKAGVHLVGAGTSTILRNRSDNWQTMIRIGGGDDIGIRSLTIDGAYPTKTPNTLSQSTIRGEGIIVAQVNGDHIEGPVNNLVIDDVQIINTGHYGIGIQDRTVSNAKLTNLTFANIGGDCIDIKSTTAYTTGSPPVNVPAYPKEGIIIDNVFVKDGCGHNASETANVGHQQQACIDVGGTCRVTNVHIEGLETYTDKDTGLKLDGCAGVRFRAPVSSEHRLGSEGSSGSNIYVDCVQAIGSGTGSEERVYGVVIHDSNITLNNVRVNQTYGGVVITNSGDGVPKNCSVNNIVATNIKGSDTGSRGIRVGAHQRGCVVSGTSSACDVGLHVDGVANTFDVVVNDCTTAADIPSPGTISGKIVDQSNLSITNYGGGTIIKTYDLDVTASSSSDYILSGSDRNGSVSGADPSLSFYEGDTINFAVSASGHPFYLKVDDPNSPGNPGNNIPGLTNQGTQSGTISWTPGAGSAGTYYYQCGLHSSMLGTITILSYGFSNTYVGDNTFSGSNSFSSSTPSFLFNSTKNSGSWAANDDPMGAIKVESADTSGPKDRGQFGLFPTGTNNSSSRWKFDVDGNINIFDIRTDIVQTTAVFKLPERAMSQLPTPSSVYRGSLSFANTSRGFQLVFCDGTNWLYQDTRNIIS